MSSISFDNVYLLLLIIPLAALFVAPYAVAVRKDNISRNNVASMVLHVVMAALIGFAAAGTSIITTVTETDVYVLADVSYSASRNLDTVDGYIRKLKANLPDNSRLGLICFGSNYRLVSKLGAATASVKTALPENGGTVDDGGTDIISALSYAGTLFRENAIKRIVLITDGRQTTGEGTSELKAQIDALGAKKIRVDAIYLDDNLAPGDSEAQICSVNYTQSVYTGSDQRAQIEFRCNYAQDAKISADGVQAKIKTTAEFTGVDGTAETYGSEDYISLVRGYTNYRLKLNTEKEGTVNYTVTLEITDAAFTDCNPHNNVLKFTQYVGEVGKTLLLTQKEEDYAAIKQFIAEDELDYYINVPDVPSSVEELCRYDRIILSNINLDYLSSCETFLESLETVVSSFGKSLMTFGDVYVQSDDDGSLKTLKEMMPIKYGVIEDKRLFTIAIDGSHSMFMGSRLKRAQAVAKALVNILRDEDDIILIVFDGDADRIYEGKSREEIIEIIDGISTEHGTNIGSALDAAAMKMTSTVYGDKRLMLISDGLSYQGDTGEVVKDKISKLRRIDVLTSTFAVGTASQCPTGVEFLNTVARLGGSEKSHDVSTFEAAEQVINYDLAREQTPDEGCRSWVTVKRSNDGVFDGVTANAENVYVNYFVAGKKRESATTVMTVSNKKGGDAPLYAYWKYGSGTVASFATDICGDNIKSFLSASMKETLYKPLFSNMIEAARPEEKINYPFIVDVTDNLGYATVQVTPYEIHSSTTQVQVKVTKLTADGVKVSTPNVVFANSAYVARFDTDGTGEYSIEITYSSGENVFVTRRSVSITYSAEYDSFAMFDEGVLQNAVGANGSVVADGELKIENDRSEVGMYRYSLAMPILFVCVALYAADIAVRKLKREDIVSFFKGVKKS